MNRSFRVGFEPFEPEQNEDSERFHQLTQGQKSDVASTSGISRYVIKCFAFAPSSVISGNPKQGQWRHCPPSVPLPLAAAEVLCSVVATAICSNGSRPVVNGKRTSREGVSSSCMPFATPLMMNCVICCRASTPLPLAATGAPCSGVTRCHLSQWVKARCEW